MDQAQRDELLKLTPEEADAIKQRELLTEAARQANEALGSNQSISDLFSSAIKVSPLESAVMGGDLAFVKTHIKEGADINALATSWCQMSGVDGCRVLHVAAEQGSFPIVELLVQLGADTSVQTSKGDTPLDLARQNGHEEIAAYLNNYSN